MSGASAEGSGRERALALFRSPCTVDRIVPATELILNPCVVQVWGRGCVTLLGDAAHLATPGELLDELPSCVNSD